MSKSTQTRTSQIAETGFSSGVLFIAKTIFLAYCISVLLLFLLAIPATFRAFSDRAISIGANMVTAISVLLCGFSAGRHFSSKGLLYGAICGIFYTGILCIIGCLVARTPSFSTNSLTAMIIGIICGAVGGIVGINTKRSSRHR